VAVQEVTGDKRGSQPADYKFFYCNESINYHSETGLLHQEVISAVKRVKFIRNRMSYIIIRRRLCDIIVLNVHETTEDKSDDMKNRFYEELESVLDQFPKYHMKILFGDFTEKKWVQKVFPTRNRG
jgi:hypothetical protein